MTDETLLLTQNTNRAGFYIGGTLAPSVITNAITIKLERARAPDLRQQIDTSLERDTYKKWVWEA